MGYKPFVPCAAAGWEASASPAAPAEHWCDLERGHEGSAVPVVFHRCSCGVPWPVEAVQPLHDAVSQPHDAVSQSHLEIMNRMILDEATRPSYFERFMETGPRTPRPWWLRLWWRLEYRQHRIRELVALWIAPWLEPE